MKFHTVNVQGKFWTQRVADKDTTQHKNVIDEARLIYSEDDGKLYYGTQTDWKQVMGTYDFITSDTRMMFGYFPLPDGWNINTTKDDMTVMITQTSDVGQIEGSWTITGMEYDGIHGHGAASTKFPGYFDLGTSDKSIKRGTSDIHDPRASNNDHFHGILEDGYHSHGFNVNWRPSYIKFLEAKFD